MKLPVIAFSAFCAMMLATGCSQDEPVPSQAGGNSTQVPLAVTSAEIQAEVTVTRAASLLGFDSRIGVFLGNDIENKFYATNSNVQYFYSTPAWIPFIESERIYVTSADVIVCAYYPYRADVTDATKVSLVPRLLAAGEVPLAYATKQTVSSNNQNVSFRMQQACSWLELAFKRGNTKDDITLSEISLVNNGLYKESLLDITTGSVTNTAAEGGKVAFTGDIALAKNTIVTRNISMPPSAALPGGLKVGVKIKEYGDKVMSTTLAGLTSLERGYKYAVTITVDGNGMDVSVEVLPWTTTTVDNGGTPLVPLP